MCITLIIRSFTDTLFFSSHYKTLKSCTYGTVIVSPQWAAEEEKVIFTSTHNCPLVFSAQQRQHWFHIQISSRSCNTVRTGYSCVRFNLSSGSALSHRSPPFCRLKCDLQIFSVMSVLACVTRNHWSVFQDGMCVCFFKMPECLPHTLLLGNGNCRTG